MVLKSVASTTITASDLNDFVNEKPDTASYGQELTGAERVSTQGVKTEVARLTIDCLIGQFIFIEFEHKGNNYKTHVDIQTFSGETVHTVSTSLRTGDWQLQQSTLDLRSTDDGGNMAVDMRGAPAVVIMSLEAGAEDDNRPKWVRNLNVKAGNTDEVADYGDQ